jgi:hypothetical protein
MSALDLALDDLATHRMDGDNVDVAAVVAASGRPYGTFGRTK